MTLLELETAIMSLQVEVGTDHCRYQIALETGVDPVLGYTLVPFSGPTKDWSQERIQLEALYKRFYEEMPVQFRHCHNGDWRVEAPDLGLTFYQWPHLLTPAGVEAGNVASRLTLLPELGRLLVGERVRWMLVQKGRASYD